MFAGDMHPSMSDIRYEEGQLRAFALGELREPTIRFPVMVNGSSGMIGIFL